MIIKTGRLKTLRYDDLIPYVASDKGRIDPNNTFTICHNLSSTSVEEIIQEFEANDTYRKKRQNGIVTYHEKLSFSTEENREYLTMDVMEDLTRKFIELRGPNALCYAKPHIENDNIHIHAVFSGTEYKSSKVLRLDNKMFRKIRVQLEEYQKMKYPELGKSLVYTRQHKKVKEIGQKIESEREKQMKKRTGLRSDKDKMNKLLLELYHNSDSRDDFLQKIVDAGIELYKHRRKINGVRYKGTKHKFKTLGFEQEHLQLLNKSYNRLKELESIKAQKELRTDKGRGRELSR